MGHLTATQLFGNLRRLRRAGSNHREPSRQSVIILVRSPQDKQVKSRLAATIGSEFAAEFYRRCAEHIVRETSRMLSPVRRYVFHTTGDGDAVRRWLGHRSCYVPQAEGSLGERLRHAFDSVFSQGAERAVIIATDVPELTRDIMDEAMRALDSSDLVIGPSCDGGYYLLGMKSPHPELFSDIPWSTERVYEETALRIKAMGLSFHVLPVLRDIDTEDDLRRWLGNHPRNDRWVDSLAKRLALGTITEPGSARNA